MATLDWSQCPAVEGVSGGLVFRGTRTPVSAVFEQFKAGAGINQITNELGITEQQVNVVLDFVSRSLEAPNTARPSGEHASSTKVHGDKIDTSPNRT
ncbi:MAG: DUF433 domain-containing protein [Acidobacteriaceae bacterium]|nr:DUF433 domain-containing protein [Acidobacteriaceae bacterium]